ncbi:MAG: hypothetical protein HOK55_04515 [Gammaproteobacteria bacterium]|nr:hypothetical protein [Gammaproteobacteria bacterium]
MSLQADLQFCGACGYHAFSISATPELQMPCIKPLILLGTSLFVAGCAYH